MTTMRGARVPLTLLAAVVLVLTGLGVVVATGPPAGAAGPWVPGNVSAIGLSPAPATAPTSAGLVGVSCPSPTSCIAVGSYTGQFGPQTGIPVNGYDGLIEVGTLTGGAWSWTATTAPTAGLVPPAQSLVTNNVALNSVSCGSPTSCVAGGSYHDDSNGDHGLIETGTLTGSTWSWTATTAPTTGLSPPPPTTPVEYVWGVSCPSAAACVLAGDYRDTGGAQDALIETGTSSGGTWTWVASSLPTVDLVPPSAATAWVTPSGISCVSVSSCVVAGNYQYGTSRFTGGLIETGTLVGGTWTWVDTTAPTGGLSPAPNAGTLVSLRGVSCGSVTSCVATGTYLDTANATDGLVELGTRSGSTWTWTASSLPTSGLAPAPAAVPYVTPVGVSCSSAASCVVAGSYRDAAGTDGLLEVGTLSGGNWSWVDTTAPTGGLNPAAQGGNEYLYGVSCTSAGTCLAAGNYGASSGGIYGLVESGSVGPGSVTATLTPSVPNPPAGGQFTLDLHVTNSTADTQALALGVATANPSAGVTITPPVGPVAPLASGQSEDLTYTAVVAQPGSETFTTPLSASDQSTSVVTTLSPVATVTAVPASIVVNSTADDPLPPAAAVLNVCDVDPTTPGDQCTLRAAIQLANLQTGPQAITFAIPGGGVPTIAPASALPPVTIPASIDGSTQPGGWVELSGAGAGTAYVRGLDIEGGSSVVRGLVVNGWAGDGIYLGGAAGDVVAGNRVGTDDTGTTAIPNQRGIDVDASGVTIGGTVGTSPSSCAGDCNLISGSAVNNGSAGVFVDNGKSATIIGNYVGTDITGEVSIGNIVGISINTTGFPYPVLNTAKVTVGGTTSAPGVAPGNLISGNFQGIWDRSPAGDTVSGNNIGLDRAGRSALVPTPAVLGIGSGLPVQHSDGMLVWPNNSSGRFLTIGGPSPEDGNIISGFNYAGIEVMEQTASMSMMVQHNRIGTDVQGTIAVGNEYGIELNDHFVFGFPYPWGTEVIADSNLISGNYYAGGASIVTGNRIGTNADGTAAIPNQVGITGGVIGGRRPVGDTTCDGPCNLISGNLGNGVRDGQDVEGNFIGTDITGHYAIPNGTDPSPAAPVDSSVAVRMYGSPDPFFDQNQSTVGGTSNVVSQGICDQSCNLISGNAAAGINRFPGGSPFDIQGNMIGRTVDGQPLGNGGAAVVSQSADPLTIGGPGPLGNVIADNQGPAFDDQGTPGTDGFGNPVTSISVADVTGNVVTGNQRGLVFPVGATPAPPKIAPVTSASRSGTTLTVSGYVNDLVTPLSGARVDVYGDTTCENGQGAVPLGSVTVTNPLDRTWQLTVPAATDLTNITTTSTIDAQTSPFSSCTAIASSGPTTAQADGSYQAVTSTGSVLDYRQAGPSRSVRPAAGRGAGSSTAHLVATTPPVSAAPFVGIASTPDGGGHWLVASDGGVFASGDAGFYGSTGGTRLSAPVVGMAATPDGRGYWLVASDGGVFAFGDAPYRGSMAGTPLVAPVVGMASSPSGHGYLLVASDGGVFCFGDAAFHGSEGGRSLVAPVTGIASSATGGYWLSAADGGVFAFGAPYRGSMGGTPLAGPVVGMSATPDGGGYWLVGSDGGVFSFGDATFSGAAVGSTGGAAVVGVTRTYG